MKLFQNECYFEKKKILLYKLIFCNLFLESFNIWRLLMIITLLLSNQNTNQFMV